MVRDGMEAHSMILVQVIHDMEWGHKTLTLSWLIMAPFAFPEVPDCMGRRNECMGWGGGMGGEEG